MAWTRFPPAPGKRSTRFSRFSIRLARPAANPARSCWTKRSSCARLKAFRACATSSVSCWTRWPKVPNRFVLTTRYVARAHRLLRDAAARFEVMHLPPLQPSDVTDVLAPVFGGYERMATDDRDYFGRAVQALTDGRVGYVKAIGDEMSQHDGSSDPISALTALLAPDGLLTNWCRFCYELRLHRARGYGALKAILDILAEEEGLTLTEISHRLRRTPGSTKDYLSWLEDVDLVVSRQKRYSFTDPLLRLWVRLHCRPVEPTEEDVVREVQHYALTRVPPREAVPALAYAGVDVSPGGKKELGDYRDRLMLNSECRMQNENGRSFAFCILHSALPVDHERRRGVKELPQQRRRPLRQPRLVERAVHQHHPAVPGRPIDGKWRMAHPQARVPAAARCSGADRRIVR